MTPQAFDFAALFHQSTAAQAVVNDQFIAVLANAAFARVAGAEHAGDNPLPLLDIFAADRGKQGRVKSVFEAALQGQATGLQDIWCPLIDRGDPKAEPIDKCWSLECTPLPPMAGHGPVFLLRIENTADQMVVVRRREASATEFRHRAGNLLTMLQVIARTTLRGEGVEDRHYAAFESRIDALSHTYAIEAGHPENGINLCTIVAQQMKSQQIAEGERVTLTGETWRLPVIQAQMFALALRELFANAKLHGVLSQPRGGISISWGQGVEGEQFFHWIEAGLTDADPPGPNGFGARMLRRILPIQMGGRAVWDVLPDRVEYRLTLSRAVD